MLDPSNGTAGPLPTPPEEPDTPATDTPPTVDKITAPISTPATATEEKLTNGNDDKKATSDAAGILFTATGAELGQYDKLTGAKNAVDTLKYAMTGSFTGFNANAGATSIEVLDLTNSQSSASTFTTFNATAIKGLQQINLRGIYSHSANKGIAISVAARTKSDGFGIAASATLDDLKVFGQGPSSWSTIVANSLQFDGLTSKTINLTDNATISLNEASGVSFQMATLTDLLGSDISIKDKAAHKLTITDDGTIKTINAATLASDSAVINANGLTEMSLGKYDIQIGAQNSITFMLTDGTTAANTYVHFGQVKMTNGNLLFNGGAGDDAVSVSIDSLSLSAGKVILNGGAGNNEFSLSSNSISANLKAGSTATGQGFNIEVKSTAASADTLNIANADFKNVKYATGLDAGIGGGKGFKVSAIINANEFGANDKIKFGATITKFDAATFATTNLGDQQAAIKNLAKAIC